MPSQVRGSVIVSNGNYLFSICKPSFKLVFSHSSTADMLYLTLFINATDATKLTLSISQSRKVNILIVQQKKCLHIQFTKSSFKSPKTLNRLERGFFPLQIAFCRLSFLNQNIVI
ncbi:hypothetical protein TTHERM_000049415 (macronuclear) [Tetrahymena thermophila SB210]|uniref:Uncharacterized protein n=1 Tax=Tetrahymena thermophila (strain SB210) TaxID=312017 RepID=W7X5H1_TETTS|nr:hypothetical protein TTHERM_000049415 [Tetrahymena thermophila SB210]EWS74620.1 hypothetical protein TTHERM_000049415 [Tetrahymena thermophila SB210]|eukprot:XP_012652842.1 hypothetical protein TTHERM_000049415 [Tetrahymena thermophila SB210]